MYQFTPYCNINFLLVGWCWTIDCCGRNAIFFFTLGQRSTTTLYGRVMIALSDVLDSSSICLSFIRSCRYATLVGLRRNIHALTSLTNLWMLRTSSLQVLFCPWWAN